MRKRRVRIAPEAHYAHYYSSGYSSCFILYSTAPPRPPRKRPNKWPSSYSFHNRSLSKRSQSIPRRSANHGVACRSRHVISLVNQEAVTDQRCPTAITNSTTTKLAIATRGRRTARLYLLLKKKMSGQERITRIHSRNLSAPG